MDPRLPRSQRLLSQRLPMAEIQDGLCGNCLVEKGICMHQILRGRHRRQFEYCSSQYAVRQSSRDSDLAECVENTTSIPSPSKVSLISRRTHSESEVPPTKNIVVIF